MDFIDYVKIGIVSILIVGLFIFFEYGIGVRRGSNGCHQR